MAEEPTKENILHKKIHAGAAALAILTISFGLAWITAAKATSAADFQIAANPPITYYVSTGGSDTNDGKSSSQPFRTISHAVDQATAGDTIIVRVGVYNEKIFLDHTNSGITIKSDINPGTEGCSISGTRARVEGFQINTNNDANRASDIRIEGFEITNNQPYTASKADAGIWVHGDNIEIVNNRLLFLFKGIWGSYINQNWYPGSSFPEGARNVKILDNYVCHTEQGIIVSGYDWLVEGNEVERPFYYGADDADYGRFFGHGHVIRRNFFHGVDPEDIQTSHTDGWQHYRHPTSNVIIEENIIQGYRQAIIIQTFDGDTTSVHSITIRNNIFAGFVTPGERFASWGVLISGPQSSGPQNIKVYNNLFLDNIFWGVGMTNLSEGVVKNNIFNNVAKPYDWPDVNNDTFFDHNIIYRHDHLEEPDYPTSEPNTGPNDLIGVSPQLIKYPITLADIIGPDGEPFTADDAFLLLETSPAIDAGDSLNVNRDILGTSRPQGSAHDIGPYEFNFGEPPPAAQCSDGIDNDGDGLIDENDPGCHTDEDAGNPDSYDPNDNDETHTPEPTCIDNDGDGFFVDNGECTPVDCDDTDPALTDNCDDDEGGGDPIIPPIPLPTFGGGGGGSGSLFSPLGSPSSIGIQVLSVPNKCVWDPNTQSCPNCLICGNIPTICGTLYEIKAQYLSGVNALHYGAFGPVGALCTTQNIPPTGGIFSPNSQCLGNIFGLGPHFLYNFGCNKWL